MSGWGKTRPLEKRRTKMLKSMDGTLLWRAKGGRAWEDCTDKKSGELRL